MSPSFRGSFSGWLAPRQKRQERRELGRKLAHLVGARRQIVVKKQKERDRDKNRQETDRDRETLLRHIPGT